MKVAESPVVIVGSLEEARLAAAVEAVLLAASPAFGWAAVAALADIAGRDIAYDPGGRAGLAADALQRGAKLVLFPPDHPQAAALAALAEACGARLLAPPRAPLVLALEPDPAAALRRFSAQRASAAGPT